MAEKISDKFGDLPRMGNDELRRDVMAAEMIKDSASSAKGAANEEAEKHPDVVDAAKETTSEAGDENLEFTFSTEPATPEADKEAKETVREKEKTPEEIKQEEEKKELLANFDKEIVESQEFYLKSKLEKEKKYAGIFKFLSSKKEGHKEVENDEEINGLYKAYKEKVYAKAEHLINEAKADGTTPEKLAEIMTDLLGKTDLEYAKTFDRVRAQTYADKLPGKISEKMMKVSDWYRGLSFKTKIAVGVGMFGLGAGAAVVGGIAPAAVVSLATARRAFGGMVAGTGAFKTAEGFQERGRQKKVNKEVKQFLEKMKNLENDEQRAEELRKRFAIVEGDTDQQYEKAKSSRRKRLGVGLAVGAGIFFTPSILRGLSHTGAGAAVQEYFGKILSHGGSGGAENLPKGWGVAGSAGETHAPPADLSHAGAPGDAVDYEKMLGEGNVETPNTDMLNHPEGVPPDMHQAGAVPDMHGVSDVEVMKEGSNIEKTLQHYLQVHHPEIPKGDRGEIAHKMWTKYMETYIDENRAELAKTGKLHEYQEMLRTGRVNIHAGDRLIIDPNSGKLIDIDGKISLLHGQHVSLHQAANLPDAAPVAENLPAGENIELTDQDIDSGTVGQALHDHISADQQRLADIDSRMHEVQQRPEFNSGQDYQEDLRNKMSGNLAAYHNPQKLAELNQLAGEHLHTSQEMQTFIEAHSSFQAGMRNDLKALMVKSQLNKGEFLDLLKKTTLSEALRDPEMKAGILKVYPKYADVNALGKEAIAKRGESIWQWLGRVNAALLKKKMGG